MVVVDLCRRRKRKACVCAHHNAAAHLSHVLLGRAVLLGCIVAGDGELGALGERGLCASVEEEARDLVLGDGNSGGSVDIEGSVRLQQAHAGVPVAHALGTGNLNIRARELAFAGKDDSGKAIVVGSNRRFIDGEVASRETMTAIAGEIDGGTILDVEVRTVRAIASRIHDVNR